MLLALVAVVADVADVAVEALPVNVPVIPEITDRVFKETSEPDVMSLFQIGVLELLY